MIQESATWFLVCLAILAVVFYAIGRFQGKDEAENEHRIREMEARLERLEALKEHPNAQ